MAGHWQQYPQPPMDYPDPGGYPPPNGYAQPGFGVQTPFQQPGYGHFPQPYAPQAAPFAYGPQGAAYGPVGQHPVSYPYQGTPQFPQEQQFPPLQQYPPAQQLPQQTGPHVPKPPLNACYNCGSPDHWAQDCPEPKRQVPHGQLVESVQWPVKRFRPNYIPPVVTKYPVPPHVAQQQPTPPSYAPSPNWPGQQPGVSSASVPAPQWQGSPLHQSVSGQKSPGEVSNSSRPGLQNPHAPNPSISAQAQGLCTPPYGSDQQAPAHSTEPSEQEKVEASSAPMSRQISNASTDQSVSMESDSEGEPDPEEYLLLDVPDLPNFLSHPKAKRPRLVEKPLAPLSKDDEDVLYIPLGPNTSETVKSEYYMDAADDSLNNNVRESQQFESLENDPIFHSPKALCWDPDAGKAAQETRTSRNPQPITDPDSDPSKHPSRHLSTAPTDEKVEDVGAPVVDLEALVRKYYSDVKPSPKSYTRDAPPPPPPMSPPRSYRRHSGYTNTSPPNRQTSYATEGSPTSDRSSRKRKYKNDERDSPGGQRQRDDATPKTRRNAPKVADVYNRRW